MAQQVHGLIALRHIDQIAWHQVVSAKCLPVAAQAVLVICTAINEVEGYFGKLPLGQLSDVFEIQSSSKEIINDLKTRLDETERELIIVDNYRRDKNQHFESMEVLQKSKADLEKEMVEMLDRVERKSLEEKAQIYKDLDAQKILFREVAFREARESMGNDVQMMIKDNERIHEEIKFHRQMADDLVSEKKQLSLDLASTKRELEIMKDSENEYIKQGLVRSKEIKILRERVEQLEKQQIVNIERFRARTKELQISVYKELEDATLDAAGLRRLIKIKNKELRTMKSLSATILSQRNDIEQFFLESLHEVREHIRKNKKRDSSKSRGVSGGLPSIKGVNPGVLSARDASELPLGELDKVLIRDLSWEDKELVLRVLFAKINGQQQMVDGAITQSRTKTPAEKYRAVFISEGTDLPEDEADAYQKNYEVFGDDDFDEV